MSPVLSMMSCVAGLPLVINALRAAPLAEAADAETEEEEDSEEVGGRKQQICLL
jgi:hypothetical protein